MLLPAVPSSSVSEIEFRTPYVVAERWIVARMLRFIHAKTVHSDTLQECPRNIGSGDPRSQKRDLGHPSRFSDTFGFRRWLDKVTELAVHAGLHHSDEREL
jgi:hypothetical protein